MHDNGLISLERRKANYETINLKTSSDYAGARNAARRLIEPEQHQR